MSRLSILYLRCQDGQVHTEGDRRRTAFNSLFEMLDHVAAPGRRHCVAVAFNSLFEMPRRRQPPGGALLALSLSILYLRCRS